MTIILEDLIRASNTRKLSSVFIITAHLSLGQKTLINYKLTRLRVLLPLCVARENQSLERNVICVQPVSFRFISLLASALGLGRFGSFHILLTYNCPKTTAAAEIVPSIFKSIQGQSLLIFQTYSNIYQLISTELSSI